MEEYFSADRLVKLHIGSVMQINQENDDTRFSVNLVGVELGASIITTLPLEKSLPEGYSMPRIFGRGRVFEMRTIHDGRVVAFETTVEAVFDKRLLIGSFPEMVETRRLRRETRFPCALSSDIRFGNSETFGVISNISRGGCEFNAQENSDVAFLEELKSSIQTVDLEVFFPLMDDPIVLSATVKSMSCDLEGNCKVGLAFSADYFSVERYLESLQLDSVAPFFN